MDLRVLVVCPDQKSSDLLSQILSEMGFEAEQTASTSYGLQRLDEEHFDAVVLDYRPDQSCQEFLSRLRLSSRNRSTLLVAIVDSEFSTRPVFGLGANFVLYRPLSPERTRLSLRAARGLMRRERRRTPRTPINAPASYDHPGSEDQRATLLDLSDGGTSLQSDSRLPPACKVYFQFNLPGQQQLVRLSGEVAWQDASGRAGIRFVDVPQSSRRVINGWLMQNSFKAQSDSSKSAAPAVPRAPEPRPQAGGLVANASNRRGEYRFACKLGAEVYRLGSNVPNRCTLSDVSEGGCYVEMPTPLTGQTGVEIMVRTNEMKLRIQGEVLTVHPGFGMGVRFVFRDSTEREEILRLLAQLANVTPLDELPR